MSSSKNFLFLILMNFAVQAVMSQIPTYEFTPDSILYDTIEIPTANSKLFQYISREYEGTVVRRVSILSSWENQPEKIRAMEILTCFPFDERKTQNRCIGYPYKLRIAIIKEYNFCGELLFESILQYNCNYDPERFSGLKRLKRKKYRVAPCE